RLTGGVFLQLGFSGAHATYLAGEYSPALRSVSRDIGLSGDGAPGGARCSGPYCRSCGRQNDADARFCDSCGTSMNA
ncbi:MAG: zinc ribbon domain-containing protein, partial [Actinomycetales bacterium]|nr:zinc ribbon domain-containing protein [Actinomycetales bacterium]